ncbi:hypothetical protein ACH5RR_033746 [Cinchona calisaya]|uniref:Uncharacterized protein n=1 Tax=Cinchona calisaya TaxID=153742 RepID=A0ABD2YDI4_9GENT
MASSSISHLHIIDDDEEEFDWEAAVREIDVACAQTTASVSTLNPKTEETHKRLVPNKPNSFPSSSTRQSTLDRFIGIASNSKWKPQENLSYGFPRNNNNYNYKSIISNGGGEEVEGNAEESVSFVKIDPEAAKTWIYPVNVPLRDYQFNITRTALFTNTLVALPTGLGKTLIAAVVMYNYFRWFPEGKIVFAAPSRPLVLQQIEACHNVVGIPQEWTIDLTGQTSPTRRAYFWKSKRVFFVTPQALEKDIFSGSCLVKDLVCLVIDEAHRATGKYSYCIVVRELMAVLVQLRILALTATPGSKQQTIQHIINNLQISRLEYRSESDPDVIPYVHDRKIELIKVAMGNDAVEVNNLILEVIRPYMAQLFALGVIQNRDFQTLSPCDLLNSRDKFREAPPENLPQIKYGEVEGYFGALITLYHIRKLLSGHGIKPTFDMLSEKLQQGSFARLMSRNEVLLKAKLLMQQNVSHGAPSPKLKKMLEVLIDHFKMNNPSDSRVIIFSNFRGSVRDIMNTLKSIGEFVKATEFIGQSSGKALKGQSQKVQQAALEKFRAGEFNVIVATSIGEEGLDIVEVDLVICFDANISPLRMIQRMGRTGRKHEGRVDILVSSCEGSELKGYMRKQANSKAVNKHLQNGGTNSFQFHSSPRMIPHAIKPEVQFVELSIEQFVPRIKKVNDDNSIQSPDYKTKLTDAENDLIAKYFGSTRENTWRPSLIAFPHFQAVPSRVHNVVHSLRTGMLIHTMQYLQELSSSRSKAFLNEDWASSEPYSVTGAVEQCNDKMKELRTYGNFAEKDCNREVSRTDVKPIENARTKEEPYMENSQRENWTHSFLFGSEFVSVDDLGRVLVLSVPPFPVKEFSHSKRMSVSRATLLCNMKQDSICFHMTGQVQDVSASRIRSSQDDKDFASKLNSCNASGEKTLVEGVLETPYSKPKSNGVTICSSPQDREPLLLADEANDDPREVEFSPRLTNFMECGIVPESPISSSGLTETEGNEFTVPNLISTLRMQSELVVNSYVQCEGTINDIHGHETKVLSSLINEIPAKNVNNAPSYIASFPTVEETLSPLAKAQDTSFSKEWHMNSGDKSDSVELKCKFRRLCKHRDLCRNRPHECKQQTNCPSTSRNFTSSCARVDHVQIHQGRGKEQQVNGGKIFVEEEAEVSPDVMVSDDEDELDNNSYDDSFIDDRINPTAISSQAEEGGIDMMAVYRRSLLNQSPLERVPNFSADLTSFEIPRNGSASTWETENNSSRKSQNDLESTARNSASVHLYPDRVHSDAVPAKTTDFLEEHESKMENRKRKLSFCQPCYIPIHNLEREFLFHSVPSGKDSILHEQVEEIQENSKKLQENDFPENGDIFDDDQFYDAIDLDAVEEQAAKLLGYKSECSMQKQVPIPEPVPVNPAVLGSPSFDLGI